MSILSSVERFLERLFERPGSRLPGAHLEPLALVARLDRTIDEERRPGPDGPVAPTRFEVAISPADAARLRDRPKVAGDLAAAALGHARQRGYRIPERPRVRLVADPALPRGEVRIVASFAEERGAERPDDGWRTSSLASDVEAGDLPPSDATRAHPTAAARPIALLRVVAPDASERWAVVNGRPLDIGRGPDNGLILVDALVSRHHARLTRRGDHLVISDAGSTNGTRVNGLVVREAVLDMGDVIDVGSHRLEVLPPEPGWTG